MSFTRTRCFSWERETPIGRMDETICIASIQPLEENVLRLDQELQGRICKEKSSWLSKLMCDVVQFVEEVKMVINADYYPSTWLHYPSVPSDAAVDVWTGRRDYNAGFPMPSLSFLVNDKQQKEDSR